MRHEDWQRIEEIQARLREEDGHEEALRLLLAAAVEHETTQWHFRQAGHVVEVNHRSGIVSALGELCLCLLYRDDYSRREEVSSEN